MGYGIITISPVAFAEILQAPKNAPLEDTPLDTVQAALFLPDEYKVVRVGYDLLRNTYCVTLEGENLPEVREGQMIAEVSPVYQATFHEDGTRESISIARIDVYIPHDYQPWHPQPLPTK